MSRSGPSFAPDERPLTSRRLVALAIGTGRVVLDLARIFLVECLMFLMIIEGLFATLLFFGLLPQVSGRESFGISSPFGITESITYIVASIIAFVAEAWLILKLNPPPPGEPMLIISEKPETLWDYEIDGNPGRHM